MEKKKKFIQRYWPFVLFVVLSLLVRFINFKQLLYFTWDQGRDYFAIKSIVNGDISLIGPTTGLHGFYLGPLWYYLGIPGFIFGQGSPLVFSIVYVLIACSAVPAYWIMSQELFEDEKYAVVTALILAVANSSINATTRVWNPMISVTLMILAFLLLVKARNSKKSLWFGFFSLGLVLQSEFAYGIFFLAVLFPLIFWIRQKFNLKDYLLAGSAVGLTLLPQILFELRHKFIMTRSLFKSIFGSGEPISWSYHLSRRPQALISTTKHLLLDHSQYSWILFWISLALMVVGIFFILHQVVTNKSRQAFQWQLLALFALIPYPFYLLWRGNQGNFFEYYLTAHFVFLVPLVVYGVQQLVKATFIKPIIAYLFFGLILAVYSRNLYYRFNDPENNAGYQVMSRSISRIYDWMKQDQVSPGVIRVFTPNAETEHYDAIIHWQAKEKDRPIPITVKTEKSQDWYILIEPDYQTDKRLNKWYQQATAGAHIKRREKVGDLTIESWHRTSN